MRVTFMTVGSLVALRTLFGRTHPDDVVAIAVFLVVLGTVAVLMFVWQFSRKPGIFPAIAVT
jgi:multisubunit Na+/H+ antiporter MnhF subunit